MLNIIKYLNFGKLILILSLCLQYSCTISVSKIEDLNWKYNHGTYLGDFIKIKLKNDTTFIRNRPLGILINSKIRVDGSEVIQIEVFENKGVAHYIAR